LAVFGKTNFEKPKNWVFGNEKRELEAEN